MESADHGKLVNYSTGSLTYDDTNPISCRESGLGYRQLYFESPETIEILGS